MDTANFSQQLRALPTLVKVLAEDSTHKFKVSPTGHLSVLRGTRWSSSKTNLDAGAVQSLAAEVRAKAEKAVLGPWYLRVLRGADGLTIFGERRLDVPGEPLDARVNDELLQLARAGSTGLIAGGVGSSKGSVLLWLASQLGRRELVFVSDVPPRDLLEPTATHVFPPADDRERRDLERLLRAHDCIFWDGISRGDDLVSFTSTPGAHNRWFTIDADTPGALGSRLRTVVSSVGRLRLDSCLFIEVDPDGQPSVASMVRHGVDGWTELLGGTSSLAAELDAIGSLVARPAPARPAPEKPAPEKPSAAHTPQPSTRHTPEPAPQSEPDSTASHAGSPERRRRPSPMAGIVSPKRAGGSRTGGSRAGSKLNGADKPPEEPAVNSEVRPLSDQEIPEEPTLTSGEHPLPEELEEPSDPGQGMSVDELLMSDEIDEEELLRQSGEIDLQAFVRARNERRQQLAQAKAEGLDEPTSSSFEPPPGGLGLEESSEHAITNIADGAAVDAMLEEMSRQKEAGNPPQFPDVDPDKLTPPVRDETTALTAVDMDRIRESAGDDLAWLLEDSMPDDDEPPAEDETLSDHKRPQELAEQGTDPATPIWDADPAPTNELSRDGVDDSRTEWSEASSHE